MRSVCNTCRRIFIYRRHAVSIGIHITHTPTKRLLLLGIHQAICSAFINLSSIYYRCPFREMVKVQYCIQCAVMSNQIPSHWPMHAHILQVNDKFINDNIRISFEIQWLLIFVCFFFRTLTIYYVYCAHKYEDIHIHTRTHSYVSCHMMFVQKDI